MDNKYDKLALSGDWQQILELLREYASSDDLETQKSIRKAIYKVKNRKQLIAAFFSVEESLSELQQRFVLLKLALNISRSTFLYEYLNCSYELGVRPKGTGLFEKTNRPLSEYEKREVTRHIIDNYDYRARIVHLAGDSNLPEIQENAYRCIINGIINSDIMKSIRYNLVLLEKCQGTIKKQIINNPELQGTLGKYLDINDPENQKLICEFNPTAVLWDATAHNIWLNDKTNIIYPQLNIFIKMNRKEILTLEEINYIKDRVDDDVNTISDIDSPSGGKFFLFLRWISYIEVGYQEKALIKLYEKTSIYSGRVLMELIRIRSEYAYRVMLNTLISTTNSTIRIRYALMIGKNYKHHIDTMYRYAKSLNDEELLKAIDSKGFTPAKELTRNNPLVSFSDIKTISVLDNNTIVSDVLSSIVEKIGATILCCAVGFAYRSGLKMILPAINYVSNNHGKVELIIGALQDYCIGNSKITRIDRNSAEYLQQLISQYGVDVYGYPDTFYHGKFYFISNGKQSYAIVGSSNISKTAYLNNYELDLLVEFETESTAELTVNSWYTQFKNKCIKFDFIDGTCFENFYLNGVQDKEVKISAKKEQIRSVKDKISALPDAETKYRLNLWMRFEPDEVYSHLSVESLEGYIVFLYPQKELAVFESFEPGNAYYTFRYTDFDELISQVSNLTKSQMVVATNFLGRGYHIQEKENLEKKIQKYFINGNQTDDI